MEETRKKIAECIRLYRRQRSLRQKDIAAYFGIAESTVSMWERGENMISADMFFDLADFLGVSPNALAGRVPDGVSYNEMEMLRKYRELPDEMQAGIVSMIDTSYGATKRGSGSASAS